MNTLTLTDAAKIDQGKAEALHDKKMAEAAEDAYEARQHALRLSQEY